MRCLSCSEEFLGFVVSGTPISVICDKCQEGEIVVISRERLSLLAGEFLNDHSPNIAGEPCGCEVCSLRASLAEKEAALLKKTAEATAFFEDGVKVRAALCRAREALRDIAMGTEDKLPPYRNAPAEVLMRMARAALSSTPPCRKDAK